MTHDSIGLGEDGPTHQPIETLSLLRATPNMFVFRPADGNEVSGAYMSAFERDGPSVICLTRQNVPHLEGSSIESTLKGGYVLQDMNGGKVDVILTATGSEVSICVGAAKVLAEKGLKVRIVSMPCWELFDRQPVEYQTSVFLPGVPAVSVEALSTLGWQKYTHAQIGMTTFGASGKYEALYEKFGFTKEKVAEKVEKVVAWYKDHPVGQKVGLPF